MAFRADEAARSGYETAESYLVPKPRDADAALRAQSKSLLQDIICELGPVVDAYPTWHPLVCNHDDRDPVTKPSDRSGYRGLDHTVLFANGFVTCPYSDGQSVIDSVNALPTHSAATITTERLSVKLYNNSVVPILVRCEWKRQLEAEGTVPLSLVMPLLLEKEIPCWRWAQLAETWESMRPYFLGRPHGKLSSLFVSQETGQGMKKVWNALINTGMFGPIKV
jgi:hypothetical protein